MAPPARSPPSGRRTRSTGRRAPTSPTSTASPSRPSRCPSSCGACPRARATRPPPSTAAAAASSGPTAPGCTRRREPAHAPGALRRVHGRALPGLTTGGSAALGAAAGSLPLFLCVRCVRESAITLRCPLSFRLSVSPALVLTGVRLLSLEAGYTFGVLSTPTFPD
eukprot:3717570-Prymnesium_polylepis.1